MKQVMITRSGADYEINDGFWSYRGREMGKLYTFMVTKFSDEDLIEMSTEIKLPWHDIKQEFWQHSYDKEMNHYVPVVGRRMYFSCPDYWRISTAVTSMEVVA
jgi:hypothetical protein